MRTGGAWRLLPRDFDPWETVDGDLRRWRRHGYWQSVQGLLRNRVQAAVGKRSQPTAAILDSQTGRSADQAGERGYAAGKKTKGIKRPILEDTLGLLLAVCITGAEGTERTATYGFLGRALACFRWLRCPWADQWYGGRAFAACGGPPTARPAPCVWTW